MFLASLKDVIVDFDWSHLSFHIDVTSFQRCKRPSGHNKKNEEELLMNILGLIGSPGLRAKLSFSFCFATGHF